MGTCIDRFTADAIRATDDTDSFGAELDVLETEWRHKVGTVRSGVIRRSPATRPPFCSRSTSTTAADLIGDPSSGPTTPSTSSPRRVCSSRPLSANATAPSRHPISSTLSPASNGHSPALWVTPDRQRPRGRSPTGRRDHERAQEAPHCFVRGQRAPAMISSSAATASCGRRARTAERARQRAENIATTEATRRPAFPCDGSMNVPASARVSTVVGRSRAATRRMVTLRDPIAIRGVVAPLNRASATTSSPLAEIFSSNRGPGRKEIVTNRSRSFVDLELPDSICASVNKSLASKPRRFEC